MSWSNTKITLTVCALGLCVITNEGLCPYKELDQFDKNLVKEFIGSDPTFPWYKSL